MNALLVKFMLDNYNAKIKRSGENLKVSDYFKNGFFDITLFYVIGDLITTYYALPFGYEANPLLAPMLYNIGFQTLIVAKILFAILLVIIYETCLKSNIYAWFFTKYYIISIGMFLTFSNTFVIVFGYDLITVFEFVLLLI